MAEQQQIHLPNNWKELKQLFDTWLKELKPLIPNTETTLSKLNHVLTDSFTSNMYGESLLKYLNTTCQGLDEAYLAIEKLYTNITPVIGELLYNGLLEKLFNATTDKEALSPYIGANEDDDEDSNNSTTASGGKNKSISFSAQFQALSDLMDVVNTYYLQFNQGLNFIQDKIMSHTQVVNIDNSKMQEMFKQKALMQQKLMQRAKQQSKTLSQVQAEEQKQQQVEAEQQAVDSPNISHIMNKQFSR